MKINAEWIDYMKAYRLYNPKYPQQTVAYEEDLEVAEKRAKEEGYSGLVLRGTNAPMEERKLKSQSKGVKKWKLQ